MSKRQEHFHISRAFLWWIVLPILFLLHLEQSVFVVIVLSVYANFAGDLSTWQARKAERSSMEGSYANNTP